MSRGLEYLADKGPLWAEGAFPQSTPQSVVNHLKREFAELLEAMGDPPGAEAVRRASLFNGPSSRSDSSLAVGEAADMMLLLNHLCFKLGGSLLRAAAAKQEINESREWGAPDADGVSEHKKS